MIVKRYTGFGSGLYHALTNWIIGTQLSYSYPHCTCCDDIDSVMAGHLFAPEAHDTSDGDHPNSVNIVRYEHYGGDTYQWYDFYISYELENEFINELGNEFINEFVNELGNELVIW